jgi:hypothetical protein
MRVRCIIAIELNARMRNSWWWACRPLTRLYHNLGSIVQSNPVTNHAKTEAAIMTATANVSLGGSRE